MVYFLSDIHLGASYISDEKALERAVCSLLDEMGADATHLFLLGDIMDYWFEYRNVVPRGYVRFLGSLAALSDKGVKIVWLKGNHDIWMTDYLTSEIGCEIVDGVVDVVLQGKRFVMEHGDGVGGGPLIFRLLRHLFRCNIARWFYAAIHPRWTVGFAHRWSSHSRKAGGYNRPDTTAIETWAEEYVMAHGHVDNFVFGHLHSPRQLRLADDCILTFLGDAFRSYSYAKFDGNSVKLCRFDGPEVAK